MAEINNSLGVIITGMTTDQDNIDIIVTIPYISSGSTQRFNIAQIVNELPQFSVSEIQSLWIKLVPDLSGAETENFLITSKYKILNKGKGTYGVGGINQVTAEDCELIYIEQLTLEDVTDLESTDIIEITSLGGLSIQDYVNQHVPPYVIQPQSEGYTIFQIGNPVTEAYLFLGEGGTYGQGQLQSVALDYQLIPLEVSVEDNSAVVFLENGIGRRGVALADRDPVMYGVIGESAVDLSYSFLNDKLYGATGRSSVISGGDLNIASGVHSVVSGGLENQAEGQQSVVSGGRKNIAKSFNSTIVGGEGNTATAVGEFMTGMWSKSISGNGGLGNDDRIFNVGNGIEVLKSDAFSIFKGGIGTFPSSSIEKIDNESTGKVAITREWFEQNGNLQRTFDLGGSASYYREDSNTQYYFGDNISPSFTRDTDGNGNTHTTGAGYLIRRIDGNQTRLEFLDPVANTNIRVPAKVSGDYVLATTQDIQELGALQPGDNISELVNNGDGTSPYITESEMLSEIQKYAVAYYKDAFNYSGSLSFELTLTPLNIYSYIFSVNGKVANVTQTSLSGKTITTNIGLEVGDVIDVFYSYSQNLIGTIDKNLDLQNRGLLPPKEYTKTIFQDKLSAFFDKYRMRETDVTLVQIGDSISTDLGYTTPNPKASVSPPFMTELNLNTFLEEKLRWKEQKYKRFDVSSTFTEFGTGSTINTDDSWSLIGASHRFPLTRILDGTNTGVSFKMPQGMRRLGLIVHTDFKFGSNTQITISGGNGSVEVYNEITQTWVEANGFEVVLKESNVLLPSGIYKDQDQKRIKFRSLVNLDEKTITVRNIGAGRFGYWGIEYSPKEFMFTYVASSIGGTDIFQFRKFEEWRIDAFKPDLVLQQCCIINEGAQAGGDTAYPPFRTAQNFASVFEIYYDALIAKNYLVLPYILFVGLQGGIVNPSTGEWGVSQFNGIEITIDDYIGQLSEMYESKNAPFMNLFYRYLEIAYKLAEIQGTGNIFASAIYGTGIDGTSFTKDNVHLNNYGQEIAKRLLNSIFNI